MAELGFELVAPRSAVRYIMDCAIKTGTYTDQTAAKEQSEQCLYCLSFTQHLFDMPTVFTLSIQTLQLLALTGSHLTDI